jgi:protein TonB
VVFVVTVILQGDKNPPRKIQEITIVKILPPPPPPPEQKMIEQKQELEKPKEMIKEEAKKDEPPPSPLSLDAKATGPGDLFNLGSKLGGRGLLGGGGGGGSRWGYYASMVQTQIEAALRANPKSRSSVGQVTVRIWSDASGRVSRVQLASSSGDAELDQAVREVLAGLILREPPPRDMPMPIVTRITERRAS